MRNVIRLQMEWGQVAIEEIEIDENSRDDIPPLLLGLRHVYADRSVRARWFEILEQGILPEARRSHAANPAVIGETFSICVALQSCCQGSIRPARREKLRSRGDLW